MTDRITTDEIRHLALLCRVSMSDDDVDLMRDQMANILDNIDILNRVNTDGETPAAHSVDPGVRDARGRGAGFASDRGRARQRP